GREEFAGTATAASDGAARRNGKTPRQENAREGRQESPASVRKGRGKKSASRAQEDTSEKGCRQESPGQESARQESRTRRQIKPPAHDSTRDRHQRPAFGCG